jgi:hypothetical protein
MPATTSIMIRKSLKDEMDRRGLSLSKVINRFCDEAKTDPGFLRKFGDVNTGITIVKDSALDEIKGKGYATSLTLNRWLDNLLSKSRLREMKKLRKKSKGG